MSYDDCDYPALDLMEVLGLSGAFADSNGEREPVEADEDAALLEGEF